MKDVMITTTDNPYNPFTQFDDWYRTDMVMGYNTLARLARYLHLAPTLSEAEIIFFTNLAVDDMIDECVTGSEAEYVRVYAP